MTRAAGKFGPFLPPGGAPGRPPVAGPLAMPRLRLAAVDDVRARVTASIALGLLVPGDRLPDLEVLAESLDVSLITVRRALESLCRDGLLDRRRGRTGGTFVSLDPDPALIEGTPGHREMLAGIRARVEQRLVVECGLAALAAETVRGAPGETRAIAVPDVEAWTAGSCAPLELDFHLRLAAAAQLDGAADHLRSAIEEVAVYLPAVDAQGARDLCHEHRLIAEAVAASRTQQAVALMRAHLDRVHRSVTPSEVPARPEPTPAAR